MFVMNASFTTDKEFEDRLKKKAMKNKDEALEAKGNISFECWRKYHNEEVEYVLVSKWEEQSDFKSWISRDEHIQEHKEMQKNPVKDDTFKLKKKMRSYEVLV
ncbi:antibiotic biosynthesis monooxygenase family protein [Virgibacillus sp. FSP13]